MVDYKELYLKTKKDFDNYVKHGSRCPHKCKYCREWYKEVLEETKKIKNKQVRKNLTEVWEMLWRNNCRDFDVIAHTFEVK